VVRVLVALAVVATLTGSAAAKVWPTPAAGESSSGGPEVVFTFDDGPNPTLTPKVLDILKKHDIRAVFFLVGEMVDTKNKNVPKILRRMIKEGHVLANHTMTHKDLCRVKEEKGAAEIDGGREAIVKVTGVDPVWFRAPFGVRCERIEALLEERHIQHMHWDLDPQEWKHGDKAKVVSYVTGELARAKGRKVLLLHDIHAVTVEALPEILAWISAENERRKGTDKKQIRIVQAPELAREALSPGLEAWARETLGKIGDVRKDLARVLP
jgi:peptidoglycan/xylan/chitin deacetylase (PgdA/CDA1 family)